MKLLSIVAAVVVTPLAFGMFFAFAFRAMCWAAAAPYTTALQDGALVTGLIGLILGCIGGIGWAESLSRRR